MKELKFFNTYNQITKLFDVTVMTKQQINKLDNKQSFLVLTPKKHIDVIKPPRKPRSKQPTLREILLDIQKDVRELKQWRKTVDARLETINTQFKAHGWTK